MGIVLEKDERLKKTKKTKRAEMSAWSFLFPGLIHRNNH